jgi:hypothetical protein
VIIYPRYPDQGEDMDYNLKYQVIQQRKLTLDHLGEVIIYPRYPDQGEDMDYNLNLSPSHYLRNSLELLRRTKEMAKRGL